MRIKFCDKLLKRGADLPAMAFFQFFDVVEDDGVQLADIVVAENVEADVVIGKIEKLSVDVQVVNGVFADLLAVKTVKVADMQIHIVAQSP